MNTPKSMRLHIGIFGKRNVGKSTVINAVTHQQTSIVSDTPGTTTDVVEKATEMLPLGPVVFIDTAGIDDVGELGAKRIQKSQQAAERCDVAVIVCDYNGLSQGDSDLIKYFKDKNVPVISIINKIDTAKPSPQTEENVKAQSDYLILTSAKNDKNLESKVREALIRCVPDDFMNQPCILDGLTEQGDTVILVTPIDKEAPKGRLILPQVNVLRELLDNHCITLTVTHTELKKALDILKVPPKIVITDSQVFKEVDAIVPKNIELTSFSILFARLKGDLKEFTEGVKTIDKLQNGDKILICESCTHHEIQDDIARVKIPAWIRKRTGKELVFEHFSSHEFPEYLEQYKLIIHCGACMTNRREILSRIAKAKSKNIPITNYGTAIAYCLNILERAAAVFVQKSTEKIDD